MILIFSNLTEMNNYNNYNVQTFVYPTQSQNIPIRHSLIWVKCVSSVVYITRLLWSVIKDRLLLNLFFSSFRTVSLCLINFETNFKGLKITKRLHYTCNFISMSCSQITRTSTKTCKQTIRKSLEITCKHFFTGCDFIL